MQRLDVLLCIPFLGPLETRKDSSWQMAVNAKWSLTSAKCHQMASLNGKKSVIIFSEGQSRMFFLVLPHVPAEYPLWNDELELQSRVYFGFVGHCFQKLSRSGTSLML